MSSPYTDGVGYDRISAPMERIGLEVLDRVDLEGDETVVDAGCGSGRVTQTLAERLPRGHVIGVDGSQQMIDAARERLGGAVELIVSDLIDLDLGGRRVDAVFSSATFHWIDDHPRLFVTLRRLLRDGGYLVAQCGGTGNTAELSRAARGAGEEKPFAEHLGGWGGPWNFVEPEQTVARLKRARFSEARAWLVRRPAPYEDLRDWLRVNALSAHLQRLPDRLRDPYLDAVERWLGPEPDISYVRCNIDAVGA